MKQRRNALLLGLVFVIACNSKSAHADRDFDTTITHPRYDRNGPVVLYDEAHREIHKADGTYRPFVSLLRNDGYRVSVNRKPFAASVLREARVLIVVNAEGANASNDSSAFTSPEVLTVRDWVNGGGSLLLVVDHFPFASAASKLAAAFGARVGPGMTEDTLNYDTTSHDESQLVFSRANGLLGEDNITRGVNKVVTFTGTSIQAPANSIVLLRLAPSAFDLQPTPRVIKDGGDTRVQVTYDSSTSAAGRAQAVAFSYGRGRVVIVGEAGGLSAQLDGRDGHKFGMNVPGIDNKEFVRNIVGWLAGATP